MSEAVANKTGTRDVLRALRQPKVLAMLLLGFSSGLPLYLVGNTMGYWMRENGSELSAIGFLSWVGLAYTLKFLWAPIIDKTNVPLLGRLGHRRGWMLLSQAIVAIGLAGMAIVQPQGGLVVFGALALMAAFASATQDIVIDAWRIEIADNTEELGLLTSGTQIGYRSALLVTDALILILATYIGWAPSYWVMALLMGVGILAALFLAREPKASQSPEVVEHAPMWTLSGLWDAIVGPFIVFFRTHGKWALLMLAAISLYRLPDFVMGPMNNPFYADIGISKEFVGEVRASIGLVASVDGSTCTVALPGDLLTTDISTWTIGDTYFPNIDGTALLVKWGDVPSTYTSLKACARAVKADQLLVIDGVMYPHMQVLNGLI